MTDYTYGPWTVRTPADALAAQAARDERMRAEGRGEATTTAARDVLAERARQIGAEGWTPKHDDAHGNGQMAGAAVCYALSSVQHWAAKPAIDTFWPWDMGWWKPTDCRRDLVKAGALILAEIERLDRAALQENSDE